MNKQHIVGAAIGLVILALLMTPLVAAASPFDPDHPLARGGPGPAARSEAETSRVSSELIISDFDNAQYRPAAAYNWKRHEYLVVWHNYWGSSGPRDIYARRVNEQGEVLNDFVVAHENGHDNAQPDVAYDSVHDRFLVVWTRDVHGDASDWNIMGRFITGYGPGPGPTSAFPIVTWTSSQWEPKVAYNPVLHDFMVVWLTDHPSTPIFIDGKRVLEDGTMPAGGSSDFTIFNATSSRTEPDITYNLARNEYLVVYSDGANDVFGMRLRSDGHPLGGGEFGIAGWPSPEHVPAVASCWRFDQYLVTWQSQKTNGDTAIYARFLHGDGSGASVHLIDDTTSPEIDADVACDQDGAGYLVTWQTRYTNGHYGVWGRVVHPNAHFGPQFPIQHPGSIEDRSRPAIAGGAVNFLVVWEHDRDGTNFQDIHGRLVTPYVVYQPMTFRRAH